MKIRNGFVSNSSSSSFMIAIGVVTNMERFNAWRKNFTFEEYGCSELEVLDEETRYDGYHLSETDEYITLSAPVNSSPEVSIEKINIDPSKDTPIVTLRVGNDEGDHAFYTNVELYDLNYDIGLDHFDEEQQEVYNGFCPSNGIEFVDKTYGADRNG